MRFLTSKYGASWQNNSGLCSNLEYRPFPNALLTTFYTLTIFRYSCKTQSILGFFRTLRAFCPGIRRPGREADHSRHSSAGIKNGCSYTATPHTLSWPVQGQLYLYNILNSSPNCVTWHWGVTFYYGYIFSKGKYQQLSCYCTQFFSLCNSLRNQIYSFNSSNTLLLYNFSPSFKNSPLRSVKSSWQMY